MLFKITATETVQLAPPDFHSQYQQALIQILQKRLYNKQSYRFGRILSIKPSQEPIPAPLLLTHQGVAAFKVKFEALAEIYIPGEGVRAILRDLERDQSNDFVSAVFQVGSGIMTQLIETKFYQLIGDRLICKSKDFQGIQELVVGGVYQGLMRGIDDFFVEGLKEEDEEPSEDPVNDEDDL
ncbi:RNA polymerase II subunit RPB7 [Spironucleus salmonicida]|uniref:RNA polymerase II subunit RPB7 n=1 Tax=Spironucleus salmonicida TaxID=348837 RepID=V6LM75_9EUKA|nr:RNA polymerase II subunit RPB7 [Spironucleus salmonicida]|eukprot:EST45792.1 RNA polymerase II subunit RPB7 [Spironucleus salmonicida]